MADNNPPSNKDEVFESLREKLPDDKKADFDRSRRFLEAHQEQRVYCNKCRCVTLHRVLRSTWEERSEEYEREIYEPETGEVPSCVHFDMLECCGCREVVLRRTFHCPDPEVHRQIVGVVVIDDDEVKDDVRYFPPAVVRDPPKWRFKLPIDMREVLEEIYRSMDSDNVRLPMMGARTLVDMTILEKIGDVGTFKEKLLELEKEGFISPRNREALYAALEVGNAAAHRGHAATKAEVHDVMDIVETMLQAIYVFPELAQNLKASTPPRPRRPPKGR